MIRENKTHDELAVGDHAELTRLCTADDLYVFAHASGNHSPLHLPELDGDGDGQPEAVAPSLWVGSLISAVLGNILPGPGTLYHSQSFNFRDRAHAGDELRVSVRVTGKEAGRLVRLDTRVERVSDGRLILDGEARVFAPERKLRFDDVDLPGLLVQRHVHFDRMVRRAGPLAPIPTAVVAPEEPNSLGGALLAAEETLIAPLLIGDPARIRAAAEALGKDISGHELIAARTHAEAAALAVALVHEGRARALMKGHLHTDELLAAVLRRDGGLRTGRRLTHVFVMDVPGLPSPLLISDAAINIAPDLETKVDIVQNAIDLALSIGIDEPKVGILSAVETVNLKIPSSIDAAILSKMAERGQIRGGLVDGPLAMDNAIDLDAARTKGIKSLVAGRAEVLVVPNLDSGNMLAKELTFIAHAEGAGVVMGAQVPIILTSRSDGDEARLASCAVAALHQARLSGELPAPEPETRAAE
ncbi:bifunctional enoyl-CoA hydratase/phosphate acetyltransferase [Paralimibaculum aggregatum]|uniref:Bifunctional enoyl-CoA hydratase/phosphate acetyltransferase n=1 Tax=Paralimibaculum aggregatum TaxID=3036245 RepID=A0ABQ6LFY7_9RHOB|nr:bifunctional enoyl-CoA hydratase/phosphate acetyltransferase [Limibaculum sp. NKW23]GMG82233.1 bifunctional enoyl-CoA hydratase/phosphate acetyltransferase [Limibaculum sp. NKW23]